MLEGSKFEYAVTKGVSMKTDYGQPTMECGLKTLAIFRLNRPREMNIGLGGLPLCDLVRNHDCFFDARMMNRGSGERGLNIAGTEVPFSMQPVRGQSSLQTR